MELLTGPCIVTKYLGPTNSRGSRIKATHTRDSETKWSKTVSYQSALDSDENHLEAAKALLDFWPFKDNFKFVLKGRGHDHNHYYFIADIESEAA